MPHIILETTSDLPENANVPDILEALVAKLSSIETIDAKSIKAYHTLRMVWSMGEGAPSGFAHCTVAIVTGREEALRKKISDEMYAVLRQEFAQSLEHGEVGITLELREMNKDTYRK
jgi:5-carboxymethyl-2-hydroxymuconate isomerase